MTNYKIRNVQEGDFLKIAEVSKICLPMVTERNSIYHIFTKYFKSTSLVIEMDNKDIIGFLLGFISQDNPHEGYIHLLCVVPQWRKKGLAEALLKYYLNILGEKGCRKVHLITSPGNNKALNFYQKMGFAIANSGEEIIINGIETAKNYNGPGEHKVVFTKQLDN